MSLHASRHTLPYRGMLAYAGDIKMVLALCAVCGDSEFYFRYIRFSGAYVESIVNGAIVGKTIGCSGRWVYDNVTL